jgi:hypothetical protein
LLRRHQSCAKSHTRMVKRSTQGDKLCCTYLYSQQYAAASVFTKPCTPDPSSANAAVVMHSCCVWSIIKSNSHEPSNAVWFLRQTSLSSQVQSVSCPTLPISQYWRLGAGCSMPSRLLAILHDRARNREDTAAAVITTPACLLDGDFGALGRGSR